MPEQDSRGLRGILKEMVLARTSLIYLLTDEDRRVESEIKTLGSAFRPAFTVYVWSCTTGVKRDDEEIGRASCRERV